MPAMVTGSDPWKPLPLPPLTLKIPVGGREVRNHLLLACGHLTVDHASLSRRSTVPTPNGDTSNISVFITSLPYYTQVPSTSLVPVLFRCGHLSPGIAIVHSLLSNVSSDSTPLLITPRTLPSLTSRSSLYSSYSATM